MTNEKQEEKPPRRRRDPVERAMDEVKLMNPMDLRSFIGQLREHTKQVAERLQQLAQEL
jgi:hypothetical protein